MAQKPPIRPIPRQVPSKPTPQAPQRPQASPSPSPLPTHQPSPPSSPASPPSSPASPSTSQPSPPPAPPSVIRAPDPSENPLRHAPPPNLPKRPTGRPPRPGSEAWKRQNAHLLSTAHQSAPPPAAPPAPLEAEPWHLPDDPAERERVLAEQRPLAELVIGLCSNLAARLPPQRPFSDEERKAIQPALEECLVKWNSSTTCESRLIIAVAGLVIGRVIEAKMMGAMGRTLKPADPLPAAAG